MSILPLNLVIFSTTMGHGGRHTYKETVESLLDQIDSSIFKNKVLHLKSREGEENIGDQIKSFCSDLDIRVIETKEDIVHHTESHNSHSAGYYKDIFKAYSDPEIKKEKYTLWLEDDWVIKSKLCLEDVFKESIEFLEENPNQICVRFNDDINQNIDCLNSLKEKGNLYTQAINYSIWGPTFTFQPNINRTEQIYNAWERGQKYLDSLGKYHCELLSGGLLRLFTDSAVPYSFFDPKKIHAKHIG